MARIRAILGSVAVGLMTLLFVIRLCSLSTERIPMSSYLTPLLVALGGALGALTRYTVTLLAASFLGSSFPYGTLLVNGTRK